MTNLKRGSFRLWLVLSVCWVAGTAYQSRDALTATYSPSERAKAEETWAREQAEHEECIRTKGKESCPVAFDTGYSDTDALPSDPRDRSVGDERPDWDQIFAALPHVLAPPIAALAVGLVIGWIAAGFRRRS